MNLRQIRPADDDPTKSKPDPKAPHLFQEAMPGGGSCLLCSRGRSDPRHTAQEDEAPSRWGF